MLNDSGIRFIINYLNYDTHELGNGKHIADTINLVHTHMSNYTASLSSYRYKHKVKEKESYPYNRPWRPIGM
jgi:hypothetical protein